MDSPERRTPSEDAAARRKIRVGFVTHRISRLGGGISEALINLSSGLQQTGRIDPYVFGLQDEYADEDRARFGSVPVRTFPALGPPGLGLSPALSGVLQRASLDVLHLHGIWTLMSATAVVWSRRTGGPRVVSPHGMLDPWILSRNSWKKRVALKLFENDNLRNAKLLHALDGAEAEAIGRFAGDQDIRVIPNGVSPAPLPDFSGREKSFVYIGRIHPKKNIEPLLAAWSRCGEAVRQHGYRLIIAGWGEPAYVAAVSSLVAQTNQAAQAEFVGPVYGSAKESLLSRARFLVLPSLSEGLPMSILEAWAKGTPTLMTAACNLPIGFQRGAAREIGTSADAIRSEIAPAISLSEPDWSRMASAAHELARSVFSVESVAARWVETYEQIHRLARAR